jgi:adenylate kinase family enzyme
VPFAESSEPSPPGTRSSSAGRDGVKRVVVLGPVGAGKSSLATALSKRTKVPVIHLDLLFWRAGWTPAPREQAREALRAAVAGERWILDGNFLPDETDGWCERFERADTVVFLDVPRRTWLRRVVGRVVRDRGARRPDLPDGCEEGLSLNVLRWIWTYPRTDRPRVLRILDRLGTGTTVHRLRSDAEVERFFYRRRPFRSSGLDLGGRFQSAG